MYNVVLISAVQKSDSVLYVCVCVCVCVCVYVFFFPILFYYGLSQEIVYSSLCYSVGPCCVSILYIRICIS